MSRIDHYVNDILMNVECADNDRVDLMEELRAHLEEAKLELIKSGLSEQEAEEQALRSFGNEEQIGNDLQHSMFRQCGKSCVNKSKINPPWQELG